MQSLPVGLVPFHPNIFLILWEGCVLLFSICVLRSNHCNALWGLNSVGLVFVDSQWMVNWWRREELTRLTSFAFQGEFLWANVADVAEQFRQVQLADFLRVWSMVCHTAYLIKWVAQTSLDDNLTNSHKEVSVSSNPTKSESSLFLITRGNFLVDSLQCFHVFHAHKTCIFHRHAWNTPCWKIAPQLVGMHGIRRTVTPDSETNYSNSCHWNWQGRRIENKGQKHLRDS